MVAFELQEKQCSKCGVVKHVSEFHAHPSTADRLSPACKACVSSACKHRRMMRSALEVTAAKEKSRAWYLKNRERAIAARKKYRENMPAHVREKERERGRVYREKNKEKIISRHRKYREEKKEEVNVKAKERSLIRWNTRRDEVLLILKRGRETLADWYVAKRLGIPLKKCSPDMIEAKRTQMLLARGLKHLEQTIDERKSK